MTTLYMIRYADRSGNEMLFMLFCFKDDWWVPCDCFKVVKDAIDVVSYILFSRVKERLEVPMRYFSS